MWLKLDTGVGGIRFRVRDYNLNASAREYSDWCTIDLLFESSVIQYSLRDDEALEVSELRRIEEKIDETIAGQGYDVSVIEPMEPYMIFEFKPKFGGKILPIMVWKIILWEDEATPSDSTINICLYREEMEKLSTYLKYARGKLDKLEQAVAALIKEGIIYDE